MLKKGLLKLFLIIFVFSYILVTLYGIGASEVITEGYTIITWENEVKKELKGPQTRPEKWYD